MNPKKTILLVDDESNIRLVLSAVLERSGFEVLTAEDGFAALKAVQKSLPDLVITDLRMPNMNGFELLSVLRSRYPELPTVAISGEFLTIDVGAGPIADAFFQKGNYSLSDFIENISQLANGKRTPPSHIGKPGTVWTPTGDAPVMLTCTHCLRSFPIDACEGAMQSRTADCIFCGAALQIEVVAIGIARQDEKTESQVRR